MATILIVDDHVLNRQFLLALLGFGKHRLLQAVDGADGLALAGAERPDLIITDIMMPKMDGYEFTRRMRADPALANIPVMFYTSTYDLREANAIAQACDVRWVLQKPSAPEVILAAVYQALSLPSHSDAAFAAALPAAEKGRFGSLDKKIAGYLHDLGAGSQIVAGIDASAPEPGAGLPQVARRLRQSLSDFQALGLRLTALIDLGIELASERDRQRLIETGCKIARHVGVARYAVIAILTPDGKHYVQFATHGLELDFQTRMAAAAPPRGIFDAMSRPQRLHALGGDPGMVGLAPDHPPINCLLAVPIASPTQAYGWLYLGDKLGAEQFSDIDEDVLMAVAAQIAVAYENVTLSDRIRNESRLDDLTGLPNRRTLFDMLPQALARSARTGTALALFFLDLDGFKAVNDTLGHAAGDSLLRQIAARLSDCVRLTDSVARLAGDEFTVLLEGLAIGGRNDALAVAEKILANIREPVRIGTETVHVSASIGIAFHLPGTEVSADQLLKIADTAMYEAKRAGKSTIRMR